MADRSSQHGCGDQCSRELLTGSPRRRTGEALASPVPRSLTANVVAYYMINCTINCTHPTHLEVELNKGRDWLMRLRGLCANSSKRCHAELDAAADLDIGNPAELGDDYRRLRAPLPQFAVLGGCCGTDHRHVEQICASCVEAEVAA